jgi:hypothetical protein
MFVMRSFTRRRRRAARSALGAPILVVIAIGGLGLVSCTRPVFVVPATITANCSVNVAPQLNHWIAGVPDGAQIQFSGGCYRIDQTLVLDDRHDLDIDGDHANFRAVDPTGDGSPLSNPSQAARTRAQWRLLGGSNISIHMMGIYGANPNAGTGDAAYVAALEAQHGIDIEGAQNVQIYSVGIENVYGDFVYWGKGGDSLSSGRVYDSIMDFNGRQGISVTGGNGVQIDHNFIGDVRRATFDLEPNGPTWGAINVTITDNKIGSGRLLFLAGAGTGPVSQVTVAHNTLQGHALNVLVRSDDTVRRSGFWIAENTSDVPWGTTGPASVMTFQDVDNVNVSSNTETLQANRGVSIMNGSGSTKVNVSHNAFVNAVSALQVSVPGATACSNKLTSTGGFSQPTVCPKGF